MVTSFVSSDALVLLLSDDELCDIRAAVRLSLERAGIAPWDKLEAELYCCGGSSLLLARPRPPLLRRGTVRRRSRGRR